MEPRLVDYVVEVAAEPATADSPAEDSEDFVRSVVRRTPDVDHADFALPDGVPYFCLPETAVFATPPSANERTPMFFSFALTRGDGTHVYGFALHYYEALAAVAVGWRPRVVCVISHHPFFSLFKEVVSWVYRVRSKSLVTCESSTPSKRTLARSPVVRTLAAESLEPWHVDEILQQLVARATPPRPGGVLELQIQGQPFFRYHVQRGKAPHVDDHCFEVLFQCLSLKNVVYVLNCMLLEQRVLVHSNHHGLLTPVCEALSALLFPFAWDHVYVPFLPVKLIEYLHAPVPYVIGLHTSSLTTRVGAEIFASCVVVHLDKDKVVAPIASRIDNTPLDFALARLPSREVDSVLHTLASVVPPPVRTLQRRHSSSSSSDNNNTRSSSRTSAHGDAEDHTDLSEDDDDDGEDADDDPDGMVPETRVRRDRVCEVELTFDSGPFGITFEATSVRLLASRQTTRSQHQTGASAVVKALPRLATGLAGPAERSGLIAPGSFLVAINGDSTLDLTFDETIDRLRLEPRPVRLRFLNARLPHETVCRATDRLGALSRVSARQVDRANAHLPWADAVRSAFTHMFASIFRDVAKHITVESQPESERSARGRSDGAVAPVPPAVRSKRRRASTTALLSLAVTVNHAALCASLPPRSRAFAREFTQTQLFARFVDESVLARLAHASAYPRIELFTHCVHLVQELRRVRSAIDLLFERDSSPVEVVQLTLDASASPPQQRHKHVDELRERSEPVGGARPLLELCEDETCEQSRTPSTVGSSPTSLQALDDDDDDGMDSCDLVLLDVPSRGSVKEARRERPAQGRAALSLDIANQ